MLVSAPASQSFYARARTIVAWISFFSTRLQNTTSTAQFQMPDVSQQRLCLQCTFLHLQGLMS